MNLYKISQTANRGWDTYDSAVVAAETVEAALATHPDKEHEASYGLWEWTESQNVTVEFLGLAVEGTSAGVILASFNAG